MTETTYPDWQKTIRAAQVEQDVIYKTNAAEETAKQQQIDFQHGQHLARALKVAFNIEIESPKTARLELDGYSFTLKTYRGYSDWDDRLPTFTERDGKIWFTVYVGVVQPLSMSDWEGGWPQSVDFSASDTRVDSNWDQMRARLADALDDLRKSADFYVEQFAAQLTRAKVPPTAKSKSITIEDLIKRIVEDKVAEIADARMGDF